MRSRLTTAGAALALLAALASGCSKSSTGPSTTAPPTDQAQVNSTLASSPDLIDDGLAEDPTQVTASLEPSREASLRGAGPAGIQTAIKPYTWWQHITGETRTWSYAFSDTDSTGHPRTCVATLSKHMTGSLIIIPQSPADSTQPDTTTITKPIDKTLTRMLMLKRILFAGGYLWKIVEVTGASVQTPGATTHIVSIRLQSSSGVDTTITDPLKWHALRHVVKFATSDTVTVTVTTSRLNDAVYIHRWDWRHRLHNNLDYTYSFSWVTSSWGGWRWFGIQAMTHGSIYDDTAPFDMQAWHEPFRVGQPDVNYWP
jgi:hypothetical protein